MKSLRIYFLLLSFTVLSCTEDSNEGANSENFTKIYDNNSFSASFSAIDVLQTSDGGYVVLAAKFVPEVALSGVHLLKADKAGNFVRDLPLDENLTSALAGMIMLDNKIYFVCMDLAANAKIVSFDENLDGITTTDVALTFPSAASFQDNEVAILGYDPVEKKTVVSRVSMTGTVLTSRFFTITDDDSMEDEIAKHFLGTGTRFPFQIGKLDANQYYFNGFFNFTFSLVFTNLSEDDDDDGVIQGQQDHGGFSAIAPISGGRFATSFFYYNDNYIQPNAVLHTDELASIADLQGYQMPEIVPEATVQILNANVDGDPVTLYGTHTVSKQIGVFMYEESSGAFLGSRYAGFTNPYEFGRMAVTSDGGLVIAGATYIAGRFSRICLIKWSKDDLASINK